MGRSLDIPSLGRHDPGRPLEAEGDLEVDEDQGEQVEGAAVAPRVAPVQIHSVWPSVGCPCLLMHLGQPPTPFWPFPIQALDLKLTPMVKA